MGPLSIYDETIIARVKDWLHTFGELFIELYYPHSGGSGNFYLVSSFAQFSELLSQTRSGAIFFILREQQYPIRGMVDDTLISRTLEEIQDGEWYGIVELQFYPIALPFLGTGNSQLELKKDLEDNRGISVCIGKEPPVPVKYWVKNETDDSIVAFRP
jgi:hypothetical protein